MSDYITLAIILTIIFWGFALSAYATCEYENCLSKSTYKIILGLIFWPIGIPILFLYLIFSLIKKAFFIRENWGEKFRRRSEELQKIIDEFDIKVEQ